MDPSVEIRRLIELMPASGRMSTKIVSKPEQSLVLEVPFPMPWTGDRIIAINFDLWQRLSRPQRDLALLRAVTWLGEVKWVQVRWPQVVAAVGLLGSVAEVVQADALGLLMASGLSGLAFLQIWRDNHRSTLEIDADKAALRVAQRRGYSESDAAFHLLSSIESIGTLERRTGLSFVELLRCQNLRAIAGVSALNAPSTPASGRD